MNPCQVLSRGVLLLALLAVPLRVARAQTDSEQARGYFDKATASFALGHYPVAADNFEKAFEAKPDPALLYNAAQAHRLAGNKERALVLYQNYLRLYAKAGKRSEVEARIEELKKAIERDKEVATSPPTTTMPTTSMPSAMGGGAEPAAPVVPLTPVAPAAGPATTTSSIVEIKSPPPSSAPVLVGQPEGTITQERSLTQKPVFWVAVGGVVAAAVVVLLVVALSGPKDPSPSLGVIR
jgi:hypothetical protein